MLFIVSGPVTSLSIDTQPTSATVSWTEPWYIPAHYPIVTYEAGYYITNDMSCNVTSIIDNVAPEELRNTTMLTTTFNDSMSGACYVFMVRGYTEFGPGPWTRILERIPSTPTTTAAAIIIATPTIIVVATPTTVIVATPIATTTTTTTIIVATPTDDESCSTGIKGT